jgi:hypothetical protein
MRRMARSCEVPKTFFINQVNMGFYCLGRPQDAGG